MSQKRTDRRENCFEDENLKTKDKNRLDDFLFNDGMYIPKDIKSITKIGSHSKSLRHLKHLRKNGIKSNHLEWILNLIRLYMTSTTNKASKRIRKSKWRLMRGLLLVRHMVCGTGFTRRNIDKYKRPSGLSLIGEGSKE